ncbi:MAG: hypothetical protein HYV90_01820 [Candidatus Woesebacteria bacterium]|nr:MAG: hypothetical protein HYV90_01820 [Candidatus Woesebacteria bacterium]
MKLIFNVRVHHALGRTFSTNVEIGKQNISLYTSHGSARSLHLEALRDHDRIVAEMVQELRQIDGVDHIFVEPYEVAIYLKEKDSFGRRTLWNEKIDQIVKKAFQARYDELHPRKRLVIETYPNDRLRGFATNFEISNTRYETFQRPLRISSLEYLRKVGIDGGGEFVRIVMQIPGVTQVSIQPYEARVEIANAFSWTELDDNHMSIVDNVVEAFKKVFGNNIAISNK